MYLKFNINFALKFYNWSNINNLGLKFLNIKVKNCLAKVVLIITSYFLILVSHMIWE